MTSLLRCTWVLLVVLSLAACKGPGAFTTADGTNSPITAADIAYDELAQRYNATVEPFDMLWVRTDVVVEWYEEDADGDRTFRREFGDGKFIFRRPGDTVLTVEKLGKVYLWAGSNTDRYWLFDLVDDDSKTAYVGAFAKLTAPGRQPFPLPVRPDAVPFLLGLMPLPPIDGFEPPTVELYNSDYLVELPDAGLRMLIDAQTFRPVRVDLIDQAGFSVLTSKLRGRFEVDSADKQDVASPTICTNAEVFVAGYDSRLTVRVDAASTDPGKVRSVLFDFDALVKAMKVDRVEALDR